MVVTGVPEFPTGRHGCVCRQRLLKLKIELDVETTEGSRSFQIYSLSSYSLVGGTNSRTPLRFLMSRTIFPDCDPVSRGSEVMTSQ